MYYPPFFLGGGVEEWLGGKRVEGDCRENIVELLGVTTSHNRPPPVSKAPIQNTKIFPDKAVQVEPLCKQPQTQSFRADGLIGEPHS